MSDERHSPGPWYSHVDAADDLELRSPDGTIIATWYPSQHITKANFELMRAAPEMLALLRELADAIGQADRGEPDVEDRARALLDRIDGKT